MVFESPVTFRLMSGISRNLFLFKASLSRENKKKSGRLRSGVEDRENVEDDKRSGRQQTARTAIIIKKVSAAVPKNRIQAIAESVGIPSTTCQWILIKDLNMHRMCQRIVPRMLRED
ncbi:hypothetical protein TNCV_697691 [Trichonephila clavipes]|nr:hypothetical protein TNCV_697691 [Trichonephila clavipes]